MKNIRQVLIAVSAGVLLAVTPQMFANEGDTLSSPRQTPDPSMCMAGCCSSTCAAQPTASIDITTAIEDSQGSPRMKADPSLADMPVASQPECDLTGEIEALPGSPRQKPDVTAPAATAQDETLSMR
ncbi:MAG TPA: hypothetical protein VH619_19925 [Verrucomicrobiae bacterium]|jgi:hypothetical protein|nr:hypothetical protein [Verrucomicrobiae bacterium]